ncbi:SDR family oxidoreductase [Nakamurella leprariae]|uniref:dTDP-4-dehydrorhamnose reductase n=1 Tax=Nakamurella leprariae TaxID=2803911 RepID=A0A938YJX2_9ACTN|nr:SDR family oxidoreductase [Nakamurella leprariae]MBM9469145.1 sugar nucleotide-binding protein [Nakamurella leprariae]
MKILATGAAGMLGSSLIPTLVRAGHEVVATDIDLTEPRPWGSTGPVIDHLDVRDRTAVNDAIRAVAPEMVLHLAAETSLELSDADPDHAYLTNTIATKYVALAARRAGVPLTYISTAGVFDGTKAAAYTEFDKPNPVNLYGASKYEGELLVSELVEEHYIIRAGWMVGGGPGKDHKFVSRIMDQLAAGADTIHAVTDKFGTPTYAPDFARCFLQLIDSGVWGLYHMACGGEGSRYDVAEHLLRVLGRDDVTLVGVDSEFFAEEFSSVRPRSEIMRNLVLDLQGMNVMRDWPTALAEYLQTQYADLCSAERVA